MDGKAGDGNRDKSGKHGLRDAYNPDLLIHVITPLNVKLDSFAQRKSNGLRYPADAAPAPASYALGLRHRNSRFKKRSLVRWFTPAVAKADNKGRPSREVLAATTGRVRATRVGGLCTTPPESFLRHGPMMRE
jgi:hypothetical protein